MKEKEEGVDIINNIDDDSNISRRHFLKIVGVFALSSATAGLTGCIPKVTDEASYGYILVDSKKCQGCAACMLACSLVHEGCASYSLSRIQIMQNSFAGWPDDISIKQCRQCVDPKCVQACTTGSLQIDRDNGNVRRLIYRNTCSGCGECIRACPHEPAKPVIVNDDNYNGAPKSRKCDLCVNTPYHWDPAGGGPEGKLACIEACPLGAISFTTRAPNQSGDAGYDVNLRDLSWGILGFPVF